MRCRLVLAAVFVAVTRDVSAQTPASPREPASQVMLLYDEQTLRDEARAGLADLIAKAIPKSEWPTITVPSDISGLPQVVQRFYNYYAKEGARYRMPITTAHLMRTIREANGPEAERVTTGQQLMLPPIPVRGKGQYEYGSSLRVYDVSSQSYATGQTLTSFEEGILPLETTVAALDAQRNATHTGIRLPADRLAAALKDGWKLPRGVVVLPTEAVAGGRNRAGYSHVQLMQSPAAKCAGDPAKWLAESPFERTAKKRIAGLAPAQRVGIARLAREQPLVLIDFFFNAGHGVKVQAVASWVIQNVFGFKDLKITSIDLAPGRGNGEVSASVTKFLKENRGLTETSDTFKSLMNEVTAWLTSGTAPGSNDEGIDVPDIILQAVFWRYLTQDAYLNVSFRTDSQVVHLSQDLYSIAGNGVVIMAAGNDHVALTSRWAPQFGASANDRFINVTFGSPGGRICGAYSGPDADGIRTPVTTVAPGSGYLAIDEEGTSLAAPYVAAAVWVKFLVDHVQAADMRRAVIAATRPVPEQIDPTEAGGFFDAALLLKVPEPGGYLLKRDGSILSIKDFSFVLKCANEPGPIRRSTDLEWVRSVAIGSIEADYVAWWRDVKAKGRTDSEARTCSAETFEFEATAANGAQMKYATPKAFADDVVMVTR